jgi:hypothetical protein
MPQDESPDGQSPPPREEEIGHLLIRSITNVVLEIIRAVTKGADYRIVAIVCATLIAWLYLLSPADRPKAIPELLTGARELLKTSLVAWSGWVLAALMAIVGAPTILLLDRARRRQGDRVAKLEKGRRPERMSSNDDNLLKSISSAASEKDD